MANDFCRHRLAVILPPSCRVPHISLASEMWASRNARPLSHTSPLCHLDRRAAPPKDPLPSLSLPVLPLSSHAHSSKLIKAPQPHPSVTILYPLPTIPCYN